jgi:uncharacterized membrane protein YidH (DUF202 family)
LVFSTVIVSSPWAAAAAMPAHATAASAFRWFRFCTWNLLDECVSIREQRPTLGLDSTRVRHRGAAFLTEEPRIFVAAGEAGPGRPSAPTDTMCAMPTSPPEPTAESRTVSAHGSDQPLLIAEAQLLLAEKRTSLAAVRTAIALFALPLTVLSALIATSRLYDPVRVLHLLVPVLAMCGLLLVLAVYMTARAVRRIRRCDAMLERLRAENPRLDKMLM